MRCDKCNAAVRLIHKSIEVDTLKKWYRCKNGHETIYLRYGKCMEINGKVIYVDEEYSPPVNEPQPSSLRCKT